IFLFAEYGFRYSRKIGQNESLQGFKGGDFFEWFFQKNTTCPLRIFKRWHESKTPLAEVAEVGFFCFFFHVKKRKVLIFYIQKPLQETHLKAQYFCEKISLRVDGHFHLKCRNFLQKNSLHINGHFHLKCRNFLQKNSLH